MNVAETWVQRFFSEHRELLDPSKSEKDAIDIIAEEVKGARTTYAEKAKREATIRADLHAVFGEETAMPFAMVAFQYADRLKTAWFMSELEKARKTPKKGQGAVVEEGAEVKAPPSFAEMEKQLRDFIVDLDGDETVIDNAHFALKGETVYRMFDLSETPTNVVIPTRNKPGRKPGRTNKASSGNASPEALTEYLREKGGWVSVRGLADALGWAKPEYDKARKAAVKNKLIQAQGEKTGMTLRAK